MQRRCRWVPWPSYLAYGVLPEGLHVKRQLALLWLQLPVQRPNFRKTGFFPTLQKRNFERRLQDVQAEVSGGALREEVRLLLTTLSALLVPESKSLISSGEVGPAGQSCCRWKRVWGTTLTQPNRWPCTAGAAGAAEGGAGGGAGAGQEARRGRQGREGRAGGGRARGQRGRRQPVRGWCGWQPSAADLRCY